MKSRLLIALTMIGAVSLSAAAFAQDQEANGPGRPDRHGGRRHEALERITEKLNLTPQQKATVQPILDQARPKIAAIHQEAMQKSKAVMDEVMAQIRPMLTPEQLKQLDAMHDRRAGHEGRQGRRGDGGDEDQDNE